MSDIEQEAFRAACANLEPHLSGAGFLKHAADYVLSAPDLVEFDRRNHAVFGIGLASQEMIAAWKS